MLDAWTRIYPELVEAFMEWDRTGEPEDLETDTDVEWQDVTVTTMDISGAFYKVCV